MDSLNDLINSRIDKLGLTNELRAAYVLSQANLVAEGRFTAVRFSRGVLTLKCPDSVSAQKVRFDSPRIIDSLNAKINPMVIKRLSYQIGD